MAVPTGLSRSVEGMICDEKDRSPGEPLLPTTELIATTLVIRINRAWIDSIIHVGVGSPLYERKPDESPER